MTSEHCRFSPRRWLLAAMVAAFSITTPLLAADWPQWLGPSRNGVCSETILTNSWPREGPRQLWHQSVGEGFSSPVVAGGRLILFHRRGANEIVSCFNATNGAPLWTNSSPTRYRDDHGFEEGPRGTPAIAGGRIFTFGAEGVLSCWKIGNGEKVWNVDTKSRYSARKGFFGDACSPLIESNLVIVNVGGRESASIVAFDVENGQERWRAGDQEASYSSPVAATIEGRRYAFVITRSTLTALEPRTGKRFFEHPWRPPMEASVSAATPLIIGDLIFISASYGTGAALLQFREDKPKEVWAGDDILSNHYATSVHHRGFLYGFDGRQEQGCNLRCVDLKTGKVRWSEDRFGGGTLIVVNETLLILTERGELIQAAASPERFQPLNRASILGFETRASAALAGGLYFARSKQQLVCVDLRFGQAP